jgi:hypothetical protein
MHERAQVDVNVNGKSAQKQLSALEKSAEKYKKELVQANKAGDLQGYKKAKRNLENVNKEMRQLKKQTFSVNKVVNNLSSATYNDLRKAARKLNRELNNVNRNTKEYAQKKKQLQSIRGEMSKHRNELRGTNKLWGNLKGMLPALGLAGAVAMIGKLIGKWARFQKQLRKTRHQIQSLTGETGQNLDELTAKVQATANTFDKDFNEVAKAANSLSKQMNISFGQAMEKIQDGFVNGADASGEFLDMLKEYPTQLAEVGLNADQSIKMMEQQVEQGVFSDKGIDAIKEANLRLREMPKATREALDAIGLSADELEEQLKNGEKSMFEVIQMVSSKLSELPPQSNEVGQAVADIFAGPGEDAGLKYLQTLKDINLELDETTKKTGEFATVQDRLVEANERVSESMIAVFGGNFWDRLMANAKEKWADFLDGFRHIPVLMNRVGKFFGIANKPLSEFSDTILATTPGIRELVNQVKEYGTETDKGMEALTKLNSALVETYGSEGLEIAQNFTEEQKKLAQQRIKKAKEETEALEERNKKDDGSGGGNIPEAPAEINQVQEAIKNLDASAKKAGKSVDEMLSAYEEGEDKKLEKKIQKEKEFLQKRDQVIKEFNLESFEEQKARELARLEILKEKGLLNEREYQQAKRQIQQKYRQKQLEDLRELGRISHNEYQTRNHKLKQLYEQDKITYKQYLDEKSKLDKNYNQQRLNDAQAVSGHILGAINAMMQAELEAAGDNEEKKLEIQAKYADMRFAAQVAKMTANAAQAVTKALADLGPIAGPIAAAAIGVTTAAQIAIANKQRKNAKQALTASQKASGNLDVIGEDDGRTYHNVPYVGEASGVGIINNGKPTLINETGGELIVDKATTRNIQMKAPEIFDDIKSYRVPQRADGNINEISTKKETERLIEAANRLSNAADNLAERNFRALYDDEEIRKIKNRIDEFENIHNESDIT